MQKFVIDKRFLEKSYKPDEQLYLIVNEGSFDKKILLDLYEKSTVTICADGGANHLYDCLDYYQQK